MKVDLRIKYEIFIFTFGSYFLKARKFNVETIFNRIFNDKNLR
jgi:hypothetical protein